jgi:hypothetical protein
MEAPDFCEPPILAQHLGQFITVGLGCPVELPAAYDPEGRDGKILLLEQVMYIGAGFTTKRLRELKVVAQAK